MTLGSKSAPPPPADSDATPAPPTVAPGRIQTIGWDASDPNGDTLQYTLFFRLGTDGPWIKLKDRLKDTNFEWDTRAVADGRYQVKVEASDAAVNPAGAGKVTNRVSEMVLVDNTPPQLDPVSVRINGPAATLTARAEDRSDIVAAMDCAVDSNQDWQAMTPSGMLLDAPEATATFVAAGLTSGPHQLTVRATDARGNPAYQTVMVTIAPPATRPSR